MNSVTVYALNLFTAIATIAAGYWIALKPDTILTHDRLKQSMSLGSGFLTALVFYDLLPIALHDHTIPYTTTLNAVFFGIGLVFVFDRWVAPKLTFWDDHAHKDDGCAHHHDYQHDHGHNHKNITGPTPTHAHATCGHAIIAHGAACSAVGCLIVCSFFDGIAFSSVLLKDQSLGLMIFTGQVLHVVPEGLLASSLVLAAKGTTKSAKRAAVITGVCFFVGAIIPGFGILTPYLSQIQAYMLPFSAGILLYVALSQLIPASYGNKNESFLVLVGGFAFMVLHAVLRHSHL